MNRYQPTFENLEDRVQLSASGLGTAGDYGVLAINGGSLTLRAARVDGDVGVGPRVTANGQWAAIDGAFHQDPSARVRFRGVSATGGFVTQGMSQVVADANAASAANAALAPTQSFGSVTQSMTIVGNGGTNVISLGSLDYRRDAMTLQGGANDVFVFNVSGNFTFQRSQVVLQGGVSADHVLFNFPSRGRDVVLRGAGSSINGTFLAPLRDVNYSMAGNFNGAIMAQDVDVGAFARLNAAPFDPTVDAPPPALSSVSGYVYLDAVEDGTYDETDESGIDGVELMLTGTDDLGNPVSLLATTANGGFYSFGNLRGGNYQVTETQPEGYMNGLENDDNMVALALGAGQDSVNNNFGELPQIDS